MPVVTPKLGLTAWTSVTDPYDSDQLADNWFKVDQHDHSQGRGVQISTGGIADKSITSDKIDPDVMAQITGTTGAQMPIATVMNYAAPTPPTGWRICDGSSLVRADFPGLWSAIGTTYGPGSNPGLTFALPNLQERVIIGPSGGMTRGTVGGSKTASLSIDNLPAHNHPVTDNGHGHILDDPGHTHPITRPVGGTGIGTPDGYALTGRDFSSFDNTGLSGTGITMRNAFTGITVGNRGNGVPHENMQPYMVMPYIIKVV